MIDALNEAALGHFGIPYLFPYQRLVVSNILECRDQIVILPTGAGKSLCFMLPALLLDGITIVIFPLLSLIADQRRRLEQSGLACGVLSGAQPRAEREAVWNSCSTGRTRIILTNPETVCQSGTLERLAGLGIAHLVVDEAHTASEWGESFRPSYLELGRIRTVLGALVTTAFTATASPLILKKVRSIVFGGDNPHIVQAVPDRPNIHYSVLPVLSKGHAIRDLAGRIERPGIIFCRSRTSAEMTARMLIQETGDRKVRFYHAGLEKPEKARIEGWFFDSVDGILTSTSAYGMGVDKANIRTVIHRELPPSVESYLQESGRAGRDREPAAAIALSSVEDASAVRRLSDPLQRSRFEAMVSYALNCRTCRREQLLALLDAVPEACFGCDVCDGNGRIEAAEQDLVMRIARRNSGRFTLSELRSLLGGQASIRTFEQGLWRYRSFGAMSGWTDEEIDEALLSLRLSGNITVRRRGPWKRRVRSRSVLLHPPRTAVYDDSWTQTPQTPDVFLEP